MKCFSHITCGMNREMTVLSSVETQTDPIEFETISGVSYESSEEKEIKTPETVPVPVRVIEIKLEEIKKRYSDVFVFVFLFIIISRISIPMLYFYNPINKGGFEREP